MKHLVQTPNGKRYTISEWWYDIFVNIHGYKHVFKDHMVAVVSKSGR